MDQQLHEGSMTSSNNFQESPDVELSDSDMYQLLQDAEKRLNTSVNGATSSVVFSNSTTQNQGVAQRLSTGTNTTLTPYISTNKHGAHVDGSKLIQPELRMLANGFRTVNDPHTLMSKSSKTKSETAGSDWYDMPRTNLTPALKRDLQLLRMRSVLDPKRHYKKDNSNKSGIPVFSQVGTIIEGPTEFFSSRLTNKERKRTLVEEVLEGERNSHRFKSKYRDIQKAKTSGKKEHYKALKAKRRSGSHR